ncbi:hypothetical protein BX600DRAFT_511924 [Xylariales sp. PMI_506]|nr:hypothetical protein BX600DRAFT_511924 [Xylariales sp. PMI_506]
MAAASVLIPISAISENGGTLPPSALVQHSPRHGRSRAASIKGKNRYNVMENRDVAISKAVAFVLKRAIRQSEVEEESEEDEGSDDSDRLISTEDGWVAVPDLLQHSRITDLRTTLSDLVRIASVGAKARFELRQRPGSETKAAESYQIRSTHKRDSLPSSTTTAAAAAPIVIEGDALTADKAEELPEFVVYQTSYEAYPHIVAAEAIQRAPGATHISFAPVSEDGEIAGTPSHQHQEAADISIFVNLRQALSTSATTPITWHRTTTGAVVTTDEVPRSLWHRAVARRSDVGVLFEDGEVRNEVPEALRGKGSKGKAKKGKGALKGSNSGTSGGAADDGSDSASDE